MSFAALALLAACDPSLPFEQPSASESMELSEVASLLSELPLAAEQFNEVYDAVCSSSGNGYDEEYTMASLFESPGRGVGEEGSETKASGYATPIRSLIDDYFASRTRGGDVMAVEDPEAFIEGLKASDVQIYWPYSENWDGKTAPVITFDPGTGAGVNVGYEMTSKGIRTVLVDEEMAMNRPVWVINRNDDASYKSIEMLRREDPDWAQGGNVTVTPHKTRAAGSKCRTLVLKTFRMKRNYDAWFAGASEFFVKCGAVESFTASTEAELKLYSPQVTDFMVVVRRGMMGYTQNFNAVLVSEWTDQLENFAFMIVEDDGGTRTSWKCSCMAKIESKSYGFEMEIPFRTSDDVVWRGMLSRRYFEKESVVKGHFGDVELSFTFE